MTLLGDLWRLDRALVEAPCPGCGGRDRQAILHRDRYLLAVDVSLCRACGLVHTARHLPADAADTFYRTTYPRLMRSDVASPERIGTARLHAAYRFLRLREVVPSFAAMLEIGCGLGHFLDECRRQGVARYHGLEPNAADRRYAAERLGLASHLDGASVEAMASPPFPPDLMVLFHVLEHLDDPGALLDRLGDWLTPGGWLVVEVPDILGEWGVLGVYNFHIGHRSYFSAESLCGLLARRGFVARQIDRCDADGIFPGNLRVFAQRGAAETPAPVPPSQVISHVRQRLKPWSLATGYPRWALRLARRTVGA